MKKEKKKAGTMDVVLVMLGIFLVAFVVVMIALYYLTGGIPDTLCTCVFAICGGECGVMGWIKTTKDKNQDRQYIIEDRKYEEKREKEFMSPQDAEKGGVL